MAIAVRINTQFLRDKRFLGLSLMVPLLLIVLLKYVFDSLPFVARFGIHLSDYALLFAAYLVHFMAYVLSTIVLVRDRIAGHDEPHVRVRLPAAGDSARIRGRLFQRGDGPDSPRPGEHQLSV